MKKIKVNLKGSQFNIKFLDENNVEQKIDLDHRNKEIIKLIGQEELNKALFSRGLKVFIENTYKRFSLENMDQALKVLRYLSLIYIEEFVLFFKLENIHCFKTQSEYMALSFNKMKKAKEDFLKFKEFYFQKLNSKNEKTKN